MFLPRSWKWQTTLACEMPSLPDILRVQLKRFTSIAWSMTLESMVLDLTLPDYEGSWNQSKISSTICLLYCD